MTRKQSQRINRIINDLGTSIRNDIAPMIQPNNPEGGYFGVPRMVLCYINFLGLLFMGWNGEKKENGDKDNFATTKKAKDYIKKVLSQVDSLYKINGDLLYDMYRHGTVHIYSPKKLVSREFPKKTVEWLVYKGEREQWEYLENRSVKYRHLQIIEWPEDRFVLPVSILVLYRDLLVSIELYQKMIYADKSENLLKNILSVADALDKEYDGTPHNFWANSIKL